MSGGWVVVFGALCGAAGGFVAACARDVQRRWTMRRLEKRWLAGVRKNGGVAPKDLSAVLPQARETD